MSPPEVKSSVSVAALGRLLGAERLVCAARAAGKIARWGIREGRRAILRRC